MYKVKKKIKKYMNKIPRKIERTDRFLYHTPICVGGSDTGAYLFFLFFFYNVI